MAKRLISVIIAAAMIAAMCSACGTKSETQTTATSETTTKEAATTAALVTEPETYVKEELELTDPQELVIGVQADPGSMWAGGYPNSGKRTMRQLCYETLFNMNYDGGYDPALGKSYEVNGQTVTIKLFDYIKDCKGNAFTASDAVFSIQKHIDDGQEDYLITEMKAVDDYTLEVSFEPYTPAVLEILFETPLFTEKAWNDSGDDMASEPVGTNGFMLSESVPGTSYTFVRNENYWQTDEEYINENNDFHLDKITMKVITDTSAISMALEKGEIDISPDIASADFVNFIDGSEAKEGYALSIGRDAAFARIDFNCGENSLCSDENLRKAIAYAVDAEACGYNIHGAFSNTCLTSTNPGLMDSDESLGSDDYYAYNVEKAKEYLEKSSYNGETLKILVMPNKNIKPSATLVQQYLAAVGIKAELLAYEFAQYKPLKWESTGKEWDMQLQGVSSSDLYQYQSVEELGPRNGESGENLLFFYDEELEKLYLACTDEETMSLEATKALTEYVDEHCYLYGLYYGVRVTVHKDYLKGIFPSASAGSPIYRSAYIQK